MGRRQADIDDDDVEQPLTRVRPTTPSEPPMTEQQQQQPTSRGAMAVYAQEAKERKINTNTTTTTNTANRSSGRNTTKFGASGGGGGGSNFHMMASGGGNNSVGGHTTSNTSTRSQNTHPTTITTSSAPPITTTPTTFRQYRAATANYYDEVDVDNDANDVVDETNTAAPGAVAVDRGGGGARRTNNYYNIDAPTIQDDEISALSQPTTNYAASIAAASAANVSAPLPVAAIAAEVASQASNRDLNISEIVAEVLRQQQQQPNDPAALAAATTTAVTTAATTTAPPPPAAINIGNVGPTAADAAAAPPPPPPQGEPQEAVVMEQKLIFGIPRIWWIVGSIIVLLVIALGVVVGVVMSQGGSGDEEPLPTQPPIDIPTAPPPSEGGMISDTEAPSSSSDGILQPTLAPPPTATTIIYDLVGNIVGDENGDNFGRHVVLSDDGTTMAVSASNYIRMYRRPPILSNTNNNEWEDYVPIGQIDVRGPTGDYQIRSIAISDNGNRIVLGVTNDLIGDDDGASSSSSIEGFVRVFDYIGASIWNLLPGSLAMSDSNSNIAGFGTNVALFSSSSQSGEGSSSSSSLLAVSAPFDSVLSEIGLESNIGRVQVYNMDDTDVFTPVGQPIFGEMEGDEFGSSIAFSSGNNNDAIRLAVQSRGDGDDGRVAVFEYNVDDESWQSRGQIIEGLVSTNNPNIGNGNTVAFAADGQILGIIGGSSTISTTQEERNNENRYQKFRSRRGLLLDDGIVRRLQQQEDGGVQIFRIEGCCSWTRMEMDILPTSITTNGQAISSIVSIAISESGLFLVLGVTDSEADSILVYRRNTNDSKQWEFISSLNGANSFGYSTSLSENGLVLAVGASQQGTTNPGEVFIYSIAEGQIITDSTTTQAPTILPPLPNEPTDAFPFANPSSTPTAGDTDEPTTEPSMDPTVDPTAEPTKIPSQEPTAEPTKTPSQEPTTRAPTENPSPAPNTQSPTSRPTNTPTTETPTSAPTIALCEILSIEEEDGQYIVEFQTNGFTPVNPGQHVHFFFDTTAPEDAGMPGSGPWQLYPEAAGLSGASPFTLYDISDRPIGATQMCILVANQNHSVRSGTGNCIDLPAIQTDAPSKSPTRNPTRSPTKSPTERPTESPTKRPTESPTDSPTPAPLSSQILSIEVDDGTYIVEFETGGFLPVNPGQHVHFFFDTTAQVDAGRPGSGPWQLYPASSGASGASPFTLYDVSERPMGATQMCILVANPDHSIQIGTGNCVDLPPDETTSPTSAPTETSLPSRINSIEVDDGTYIVDFETSGFLPVNPGQHVHFFFDTTAQEEAGRPGSGPWQLYPASSGASGASPFTLYDVSERPSGATQMCILVANPDHSIQLGTGNCVDLP